VKVAFARSEKNKIGYPDRRGDNGTNDTFHRLSVWLARLKEAGQPLIQDKREDCIGIQKIINLGKLVRLLHSRMFRRMA